MSFFLRKTHGGEFINKETLAVKPPSETPRMMIMPQALLTARLCPRGAEVWGPKKTLVV